RVQNTWHKIARLFAGGTDRFTADKIISQVLADKGAKPVVIVDISQRPSDIRQAEWNDNIKPLIIDRFINALVLRAENAYQENASLNTLIVLDEAHRLVPQSTKTEERIHRVKAQIVDAVRTTR